MDFQLSAQQKMMQDMVRKYVDDEIRPAAADLDETGIFPRAAYQKMCRYGLQAIALPKEYGGVGADYLTFAIAIEEIAKACLSTTMILGATNSLASYPILAFGTEEQKQNYIGGIASGKYLNAFALTEPNAGSDAASQQTTAVLDGDEYVLNGTKTFITNAGEADYYVVFAMTNKSLGAKGITAFIIDYPTEGFSIGKLEKKMGLHGSATGELIFQNCRVPKSARLGNEGQGFAVAMSALNGGRISIAAQSVGLAQGALDEAVKFVKRREQFGRPLSANQAVQFMLADMETDIEAGRSLYYRAASLKDNKIPCDKESSIAKLFCSEMAMRVVTKAVQLHGGYGYTADYSVERMFRDAKILSIYEGTSEVQRIVISREVLKR